MSTKWYGPRCPSRQRCARCRAVDDSPCSAFFSYRQVVSMYHKGEHLEEEIDP
ncbi:hypothetical protein KP004_18595 [Geomonas oryzisoli]|uniref:Uncharacterized protein n=1 Tax=Geomonas oryzisoli TaxID=2847992 RepID=A0ABX8J7W2_9BACT|nr:hypothetical protein [Geomonas oryzisoli]QWV93151.1 hypothetical protein KP004_18595 [Geomonas oryzisoli]